jgi:hypothetical protein
MTLIEILAIVILVVVISAAIWAYGHVASFHAKLEGLLQTLHLVHASTLAPVSVVNAPAPTPPATVMHPPSVIGFDGKSYPDQAAAKAAWVAAGRPIVDYLSRAIDVNGQPWTGFSPPPVFAANVATWNPDGTYVLKP